MALKVITFDWWRFSFVVSYAFNLINTLWYFADWILVDLKRAGIWRNLIKIAKDVCTFNDFNRETITHAIDCENKHKGKKINFFSLPRTIKFPRAVWFGLCRHLFSFVYIFRSSTLHVLIKTANIISYQFHSLNILFKSTKKCMQIKFW